MTSMIRVALLAYNESESIASVLLQLKEHLTAIDIIFTDDELTRIDEILKDTPPES